MVEFGLKLSDNQVADWREHYIDYEKLKAILTKCSLSVKRLEEVSLRKPGIAASITEAYKAGLPTPHASVVDLPGLLDQSSSITKSNNASSSLGDTLKKIVEESSEHGSADPTETTELKPTSGFYGTTNTDSSRSSDNIGVELDRVDSKGNLLSRAFVKATSGVTDYFQKNYERTLRDTLKEIDSIAEEFDVCFHENIARVNTFYTQKLEELEGRVVYLKESVTDLRQVPGGPPPAPFDEEYIADEDNNETPLVSHRKSAIKNPIAFAKAVARNFTSQMRHRPHSKSEMSNSSESAGLLTGEGASDQ